MIDETTAKRRQPGELLTKNDAMRYARARTVKIPQTCKEIEEEAFLSNGKMITLLLPNGLEQIGNNAFRRNRLLREVALPHSICKVGSGCFSECEVLEAAYLSKQLKVIPENMFRSDRHLKKVLFTKDSQLETIEGFAFYDCNALEVILLPAGVQEIGDKAFYRCKNLKTVRFPKGLKRIGREAFNFCKVQQLDLPDTLEEIDKKAFFCCKYKQYSHQYDASDFQKLAAFHLTDAGKLLFSCISCQNQYEYKQDKNPDSRRMNVDRRDCYIIINPRKNDHQQH